MHRILQDFLWLAPAVLECVIAMRMWRLGLLPQYPAFWGFLVLDLMRTALLWGIGNNPAHYSRYFYVFWATEGPSCLLALLAVMEIFRKAFARRLGLEQRGADLFRISIVLLIGSALLVSFLASGSDSSRLIVGTLILKEVESVVLSGLAVALFVFVFFLGLPWSNYNVGIAAGFAVTGVTELAAWFLRVHYGRTANRAFVWTLMAATLCQTIIWAAYLLPGRHSVEEPYAAEGPNVLAAAAELERMNEQVQFLLEKR